MVQIVAVLPSDTVSHDVFDVFVDPAFSPCLETYAYSFVMAFGSVGPPPFELEVDDFAYFRYEQPTGQINVGGLIRIGRTLSIIDASISWYEPPRPLMTEEEFGQILQQAVDRARAAFAGTTDPTRGVVMTTDAAITSDRAAGSFGGILRVIVTAGVPAGLIVVGIGSRLAMLLLRVTSSESVIGVTSDDGFTIGRFTFTDSYGLMQIGALVGPIGAATYLLLRRWLIGPRWFGDVTVALAAGAVGGSMLLHADGVDFALLGPRWLAIGLFVAIPALFGVTVAIAVDAVERRTPPPNWSTCLVLLACGPGALVSSLFVVPVTLVLALLADRPSAGPPALATSLVIRAVWLGIAVVGLVALIGDVQAIIDLAPPPR